MIEFLGYSEVIDSFAFRNFGAITIPKEVREVAYTLQIDIEIEQVAQDGYKNFKSDPAYSFYGYAVIVLRDYAEIQIPIEQPRQTVYYDRLESAYTNWYALYLAYVEAENLAATQTNLLVPIGAAVGVGFTPVEAACLAPPVFVEIPIREVYVKTQFGTTFKIEVSHWLPNPVEYGGCAYDGSSGQIDDEKKDSGLPRSGAQPKVAADKNNPYANASAPSSQGDLGSFFNDKQDNLNDENTDIGSRQDVPATLTTEGFYIEYGYSSCSNLFNISGGIVGRYTAYLGCSADTAINVISSVNRNDDFCTQNNALFNVGFRIESPTRGVFGSFSAAAYGSIDGSIQYGLLPDNENFNGIPYP